MTEATDYMKLKNTELESLLKARGLSTVGKKAEKVERLVKDDEQKKKSDDTTKAMTTETPAPATTADDEDEINWDDDTEPAKTEPDTATEAAPATASVAKPTEATTEADGDGAAANPQSVPNQAAVIDPSKSHDLSVSSPTDTASKPVDAKPSVNFSRGLAPTKLEEEIEKRKARAKKFGLNIDDDERLKELERAKKFGTGIPKGLDEALPERTRKRGREGGDDHGGQKRRGGGRFGGRDRGPRGPDRSVDRRGEKRPESDKQQKAHPTDGGTTWMSEADRARAEARKKRFAAPAPST